MRYRENARKRRAMHRKNLEKAVILQIVPAQPGWVGVEFSGFDADEVEQGAEPYYIHPIACWALVEIDDARLSSRRIVTPLVHSDTGNEHMNLQFLLDTPNFLGYASPENPVTSLEWQERIREERSSRTQ